MPKEKHQIWASCEKCGLAWTKIETLTSIYKPIKCPKCKNRTENYDIENHNKDMKFIKY